MLLKTSPVSKDLAVLMSEIILQLVFEYLFVRLVT